MSLNQDIIELRTMQKKYAYLTADVLMYQIFSKLKSCDQNLTKFKYLNDDILSSDADSESFNTNNTNNINKLNKLNQDGGRHHHKHHKYHNHNNHNNHNSQYDQHKRYGGNNFVSRSVNEFGMMSDDTPIDMSNKERAVFHKRKMKKYKALYASLLNVYNYIRNMAYYYYYYSMMSRKNQYDLMVKLQSLNQHINEWSTKIGSDMSAANSKVENIEMIMGIMNKILEKPIDIDLQVIGNVENKTMQMNSSIKQGKINNTVSQNMTGGSFEDDYEKAKQQIQQIIANNAFLNEKLQDLQKRMQKVISDNENIFKIRARIDFIINKLEECVKTRDDTGTVEKVYDLKELLEILNKYDSYNLIDVIRSLNRFVSYLDQTLNENAFKSMDSKTLQELQLLLNQITKNVSKPESNISSISSPISKTTTTTTSALSGGDIPNLREQYDTQNANIVHKLKADIVTLYNDEQIPFIELNANLLNELGTNSLNVDENEYLRLQWFHLNIIQINQLLMYVNAILKKYVSQELDWQNLWNITFLHKNTDIYNKLEQQFNHIKIYGTNTNTNIQRLTIDNIDDNLDNAYTYYACLYYILTKYALCYVIINTNDINNVELNNIAKNLQNMNENIQKSLFHEYEHTNSNINIWINDTIFANIHSYFNNITIDKIYLNKNEKTPTMIFYQEFITQSNKSLTKNADISLKDQIFDTVNVMSNKIEGLIKDVENMFNRIAAMLGYSDRYSTVIAKSQNKIQNKIQNTHSDTFQDIYNILKPSETQMGGVIQKGGLLGLDMSKGHIQTYRRNYQNYILLKQMEKMCCNKSNKTEQYGGHKTYPPEDNGKKPRIGSKMNKLRNVFEKDMYKLVIMMALLQNKLQKGSDFTDPNEMTAFIKIYSEVKSVIDTTNNAFIRLLPMIFFAIEFPPELYINDSAKNSNYRITYNYPKLIFNPYDSSKKTEAYDGYHQAFIDSKNNDSTNDLLNDRLIGLNTITDMRKDKDLPMNKVSNIMFAVGASGTGKTTRYFGYRGKNGKIDDRIGIIENIIHKRPENTSVSIAYFVCYGRKINADNNPEYHESLVFVKIKEFNNDNIDIQLLPYTIDNNEEKYKTITSYTDFYAQLMQMKLCIMEPDQFEQYVENVEGINISCKKPKEGKTYIKNTFRGILETHSVWKELSDFKPDELNNLFQELIILQKRLRIIMPTVNNIESSRGHTCILLKFTNNKLNENSYFPLFDMAGTEDIDNIDEFYDKFDNNTTIENGGQNSRKLIETLLNNVKEDLGPNEEARFLYNGKPITSLKELEIPMTMTLNSLFPSSKSGGASIRNIELVDYLSNIKRQQIVNDTRLIDKIKHESQYISHTIAMLIFAILCVGETQKAVIENGKDTFNDILPIVQAKMKKSKLCNYIDRIDKENCGHTMYLFNDEINYNNILNNSCIWIQIIFSFLYWNTETPQSTYNYFNSSLIDNQMVYTNKNIEFDNPIYLSDFNNDVTINNEYDVTIRDIQDIDYDRFAKIYKIIDKYHMRLYKNIDNNILYYAFPDNTVYSIKLGNNNVEELDEENSNSVLKKVNHNRDDKDKLWNMIRDTVFSELEFESVKHSKQDRNLTNKIMNLKRDDKNVISVQNIINGGFDKTNIDNCANMLIAVYFYFIIAMIPYDKFIETFNNNEYVLTHRLEKPITKHDYTSLKQTLRDDKLIISKNNNSQIIMATLGDIYTDFVSKVSFAQDMKNAMLALLLTEYRDFIDPIVKHKPQIKILISTLVDQEKKFIIKNIDYYIDAIDTYLHYDKLIDVYSDNINHKYISQIERVRDPSRNFYPPPIVLMHCVTGQGEKHDLVKGTLEMCQTLYDAINITEESGKTKSIFDIESKRNNDDKGKGKDKNKT